MGCSCYSKPSNQLKIFTLEIPPITADVSIPSDTSSQGSNSRGNNGWYLLKNHVSARQHFEQDGSLSRNSSKTHLEMRVLLDHPIGSHHFIDYLFSVQLYEVYLCWKAIMDARKANVYRHALSSIYANFIWQKEFVNTYQMDISDIYSYFNETYSHSMNTSNIQQQQQNPTQILELFATLQQDCFNLMHDMGYMKFLQSHHFHELIIAIQKGLNVVKSSDFHYYNSIGDGGYGLVVRCMKKSTGIQYAMKIQSKIELVTAHQQDLETIKMERNALITCRNPFIIELSYAFQTKYLVMLVMSLGVCDLASCLLQSETSKLSYDRLYFYTLELISAVSYLHDHHLIHRDLKPANIVIESSGHIKLIDLGAVTCTHGENINKWNYSIIDTLLFSNTKQLASGSECLTTTEYGVTNTSLGLDKIGDASPVKSIIGTFAYMVLLL